jgi:hypothetical protein
VINLFVTRSAMEALGYASEITGNIGGSLERTTYEEDVSIYVKMR